MALVRNSETILELRRATGIQQAAEETPMKLSDFVTPVIETNPRLTKVCDIVKNGSSTGSATTIYTTLTGVNFYLTAATLSLAADVTADSVNCYLQAVVNGGNVRIMQIAKITTTASQQTITMSFPFPIKIDQNTAITVQHGATVGVSQAVACIVGYNLYNANG